MHAQDSRSCATLKAIGQEPWELFIPSKDKT